MVRKTGSAERQELAVEVAIAVPRAEAEQRAGAKKTCFLERIDPTALGTASGSVAKKQRSPAFRDAESEHQKVVRENRLKSAHTDLSSARLIFLGRTIRYLRPTHFWFVTSCGHVSYVTTFS